MTPEQLDQLENEVIKGDKAKASYDSFIKNFVEAKRIVLFESFRALPLTDVDNLMEVKRMLAAVDTLETEILTIIETGKLATTALNQTQNEGNDQ